MKIVLKDLQKGIDSKIFLRKIGIVIIKKETLFLALIFGMFLGYCGYLWYGYVYNYQWSEAKKQEYSNAHKSNAAFDDGQFERVLADIKIRQANYEKKVDQQKDIFNSK